MPGVGFDGERGAWGRELRRDVREPAKRVHVLPISALASQGNQEPYFHGPMIHPTEATVEFARGPSRLLKRRETGSSRSEASKYGGAVFTLPGFKERQQPASPPPTDHRFG